MKKFVLLLFMLFSLKVHAQLISDDGHFLNMNIEKLTLKKLERKLKRYSFKEPQKFIRTAKWRGPRPCTTFYTLTYFLETEGLKFKTIIKATSDAGVYSIEIKNLPFRKKLTYKGVILERTKVEEIDESESESEFIYNGGTDPYLLIAYKGIYLKAEGNKNDKDLTNMKNKRITSFVITKDTRE